MVGSSLNLLSFLTRGCQLVSSICLIFLFSIQLQAQTDEVYQDVSCGDIIEQAFTSIRNLHNFKVDLSGGDNLKVYVRGKYGNKLVFNTSILGPSGSPLIDGWLENPKNRHQLETGAVPGTGTYTIQVYNFFAYDGGGELGDFLVEIECKKYDGTTIRAGEAVTEKNVNEGPTYTSNGLLTIPSGTTLEGIIDGIDVQSYAFKTLLTKNSFTINCNIKKGSVPIRITIIDPDTEEIIFTSDLRYSRSLTSTITSPARKQYVIVLSSLALENGAIRATEFDFTISN